MTNPEPFIWNARVYYEDTDAQAVVYHANFFKFAERGRTEFLRSVGWPRERVEAELKIGFVVRHAEIGYYAAAKLDDMLQVRTTITAIGNTSMTMQQDIYRDDKLLADIKVVIVAINFDGKAVRFPPQLRQISALAE